jgi:GT2 family glycosyltransferase
MKVLVGGPVSDMHEYCFDDLVKSRKSLTYKNHDLLFVDNSQTDRFYKRIKEAGLPVQRIEYKDKARDRMIECRNILREHTLKNGYDYFLNLDQDIMPPDNIIERLLAHNEKIVTAIYFNPLSLPTGEIKLRPVIGFIEGKKLRFLKPEDMNKGLREVDVCGSGCIMMHREVLEKLEFRYDKGSAGFDDVMFVHDAKKNGYKVYVDTSLVVKHLVGSRPWVWKDLLKQNRM